MWLSNILMDKPRVHVPGHRVPCNHMTMTMRMAICMYAPHDFAPSHHGALFLGGYIHFILVYLNIIFFSCCPCHVATLAPCLPPPPNFPHHAHLLNLKFPIFEHLFSLSIVACLFWGIMIACASFSFQS